MDGNLNKGINSLIQAAGTSAAGIATGVGKSGKWGGTESDNGKAGKTSGAENAATYILIAFSSFC